MKSMKEMRVAWTGEAPLLMNSCRTVNPLHPLAIEKSKLTSLKTKTVEIHRKISDLEWLAGLYYNENIDNPMPEGLTDDMYVYVPAECIEATIRSGAKANKKGEDIKKYVELPKSHYPLILPENKTVREMFDDFKYRDVRQTVIKRARITRTRPRFDKWKVEFTLLYDDKHIDIETIITAMENAGNLGLCDYRPRYGKFTHEINW